MPILIVILIGWFNWLVYSAHHCGALQDWCSHYSVTWSQNILPLRENHAICVIFTQRQNVLRKLHAMQPNRVQL